MQHFTLLSCSQGPHLAGQLVPLLSSVALAWLQLPAWAGLLGLAAEGSSCHLVRTT